MLSVIISVYYIRLVRFSFFSARKIKLYGNISMPLAMLLSIFTLVIILYPLIEYSQMPFIFELVINSMHPAAVIGGDAAAFYGDPNSVNYIIDPLLLKGLDPMQIPMPYPPTVGNSSAASALGSGCEEAIIKRHRFHTSSPPTGEDYLVYSYYNIKTSDDYKSLLDVLIVMWDDKNTVYFPDLLVHKAYIARCQWSIHIMTVIENNDPSLVDPLIFNNFLTYGLYPRTGNTYVAPWDFVLYEKMAI